MHQYLVYADEVDVLCRNTETLLVYTSKEGGLEINTEKIKEVFVSISESECRQNHT
jgi:hypothetical protein